MPDDDLKDYAEIRLDRVRRLRFGWGEIRELSRRLGGASLQSIVNKLTEADPEAITAALMLGLRGEADLRRATVERIDELIDGYFKREGEDAGLANLLAAITEAIQAHGVLRTRKKPDAPGNP